MSLILEYEGEKVIIVNDELKINGSSLKLILKNKTFIIAYNKERKEIHCPLE